MKTNQRGFASIVVLIGIVLVISGGIYYVVANGDDDQGNPVEEIVAQATQDQIDEAADRATLLNEGDYPALYQQYNLPEYPGAEITYDGRTADSLQDGISLTLTTSDDVQTVGAYFASALTSLPDWAYTPPNFSNETLFGASAEKADENLHYQFTVTKLPDYTQINISFLEN